MSFLSQCLFYLINYAINILSGDTLAVDFSDGFLLALVGVAVVMMGIGFFAIFKANGKAVKYLDIPLIFLCSAVSIIFKLYVAENNVFSIVPSFLMLVPSVIFDIRCIMWIVDVARKERKPEKKNAVVLVVYIVASAILFSLSFFDFETEKQKPTEEEIQLLDDCYDYMQTYLENIPTDKTELQKIADITENATDDDVFKRAYDKSEFYKNSDSGILRGVEKFKNMNRQRAYADVVALRLKTLIVLKDYEGYINFFTDNCGYLFYVDTHFYYNLWVNDNYNLSAEDFDAIIAGYEHAFALCDNDSDRLFIVSDIIGFYNEFEPDNIEIEKYRGIRSDIYDNNDFEDLLEYSRNNIGYTSEKLAIE